MSGRYNSFAVIYLPDDFQRLFHSNQTLLACSVGGSDITGVPAWTLHPVLSVRIWCLEGIAPCQNLTYDSEELGFFFTVYFALRRTRPSTNGEDHGKRRRRPYACTRPPTQV
jgi:hypothetical protein